MLENNTGKLPGEEHIRRETGGSGKGLENGILLHKGTLFIPEPIISKAARRHTLSPNAGGMAAKDRASVPDSSSLSRLGSAEEHFS